MYEKVPRPQENGGWGTFLSLVELLKAPSDFTDETLA